MWNSTHTTPHTVYRFYGKSKETGKPVLLYVGITSDFPARISEHKRKSEWFPYVKTQKTRLFPDRRSALDAEKRIIQREKPMFNVTHSK